MKKLKAIPANVAAIWGAFLYEGMLVCSKNGGRKAAVLKKWGLGSVELIAETCAFLPEVWQQIEPHWYSANFPGVFEYEVISPLGVTIGDYILLNPGTLPSQEFLQETIEELIRDFFHGECINPASEKDPTDPIAILH